MRHLTALFILLLISCSPRKPVQVTGGERILSLAPSITEVLYHFGLKDSMIGVTDYCLVPDDVDKEQLSIGSMTPSLEKILDMKPTIVFTVKMKPSVRSSLETSGIEVHEIRSLNFEGSMASFLEIGKRFNREKRAVELISQCRKALRETSELIASSDQTVMLCISTIYDQPGHVSPWIAGNKNIYSDILTSFKMRNAYTGNEEYMKISTESLVEMNPDIILILKQFKFDPEVIKKEEEAWKERMSHLKAVKNGSIYFLGDNYMMLTGPRIPLIIRDFAKILNSITKVD